MDLRSSQSPLPPDDQKSHLLVELYSIGNMIESASKLESEKETGLKAGEISRALNLVFAEEIPLHLDAIAQALGLSSAIQKVRRGIRLEFRKALARKILTI